MMMMMMEFCLCCHYAATLVCNTVLKTCTAVILWLNWSWLDVRIRYSTVGRRTLGYLVWQI
jgi:hypothetical protein